MSDIIIYRVICYHCFEKSRFDAIIMINVAQAYSYKNEYST